MAMSREERDAQAKAYGRIVAKAWSDETFKQRFLREPAAVLQAHGIPVPEGVRVHIHEASNTHAHLVLPAKPAGAAELSEEQLSQIAGGAGSFVGQFGQAPRYSDSPSRDGESIEC